jgi:hypothetical protein
LFKLSSFKFDAVSLVWPGNLQLQNTIITAEKSIVYELVTFELPDEKLDRMRVADQG